MIAITTPDGLQHILPTADSTPDYAAYSSSVATRSALATAYAAGHWEEYQPPEPVELPPEPNPRSFKVALMSDPLFQEWQERLPNIPREDMKLAAIADDWKTCQAIYSQLKAAVPIPQGAAAQWQQLANQSAVPLVF